MEKTADVVHLCFWKCYKPLQRKMFLIFVSVILALLAESQQSLCHGMVSVVRLSVCLSVSLFCSREKVYFLYLIFLKLKQLVYLINSFNPIDFEKKKKNGQLVREK